MYLLEVYYDSKTLISLIVSFHSCSLTSTSNNPLYNKHFISTFSLVPLKTPKQHSHNRAGTREYQTNATSACVASPKHPPHSLLRTLPETENQPELCPPPSLPFLVLIERYGWHSLVDTPTNRCWRPQEHTSDRIRASPPSTSCDRVDHSEAPTFPHSYTQYPSLPPSFLHSNPVISPTRWNDGRHISSQTRTVSHTASYQADKVGNLRWLQNRHIPSSWLARPPHSYQ